MSDAKTLKDKINNLQLKYKGKDLNIKNLDEVIKEVYNSTKKT